MKSRADGVSLHGVGEIDEDNVERGVGVFQVFLCVLVEESSAGIIECAVVPSGEIASGGFDYITVYIDHHGLLNTLVIQDFPEGGAFAAAGDEYTLRGRVGDHGRMDEHLVVYELVRLRGLGLAVEDQDATKSKGVDYLDGLVLALP